jgi:membrane-associated phospholipid phosphatase
MMTPTLPFNQHIIDVLAENRLPGVTQAFQLFSFLGEIEGYVLIIAAAFIFWNRRLALQAAAVVVSSMIINHILKIIIQNPRPFVASGTHFENWAVPHSNAVELASEFSTPSGHAMAAAAFYGFIFSQVSSRYARILCVLAALLVCISRPILGVHFVEDIVLGWLIGGVIAFLSFKYIGPVWAALERSSVGLRITLSLLLSLAVWIFTYFMLPRPLAEFPTAPISYLGFLTGIILIAPAFRNAASNWKNISVRSDIIKWLLLAIAVLLLTTGLDLMFAQFAEEGSLLSFGFRYVRYALVSAFSFLVVARWIDRLIPADRSANEPT